jgi:predicted nicotinamide N-methyase
MKSFEELLREYTIEDAISVGGYEFHLQRIRDSEPLLDSISEQEFIDDERVPYWAELWPSSIALAGYILENRTSFSTKSVIEIGCGLGLTGMAAHLAGANVLFTDYEQTALKYTEKNFLRNFKRPAKVKILDWRDNTVDAKFDILIAADVLYEKRWLQPVLDTIKATVQPGGQVYLAEPGRSIASEFFSMVQDIGWRSEKQSREIIYESAVRHVDIYKIIPC